MSSAATRATSSTGSSVSSMSLTSNLWGRKGRRLPGELTGQTTKPDSRARSNNAGPFYPAPSVRHSDGLNGAKGQPTSTGNHPQFSARQGVPQGQERHSEQRFRYRLSGGAGVVEGAESEGRCPDPSDSPRVE